MIQRNTRRAYTAISCLAHALEITTIGLDSGIKRERINSPWRRCNTVDAPFKPGLLTTKKKLLKHCAYKDALKNTADKQRCSF